MNSLMNNYKEDFLIMIYDYYNCISTEIASIFPVPILYTPIQKINYIYCYNPMFHTKNNFVIIIMHIYIIIINVLFLLF